MNIISIIYSILLPLLFVQTNDVTIDFNFGLVVIEGGVPELNIKGHDGQQVIITTSSASPLSEKQYKIKNKKLTIHLIEEFKSVTILLPKTVDLECDLDNLVDEVDREKPFRKAHIEAIGGAVEFSADGYDVDIKNPESHVSIVTYGNIEAWFDDFEEETIVSLDTYLGNVTAHIPIGIEANLNLTAMSGEVILHKDFKITRQLRKYKNNFIGEINGGGIDVILHSESGTYVKVGKN